MSSAQSVSEQLFEQAKNLGQYQQLKEANEMERDATRRLYERFKRELRSESAALTELKRRGYDTQLLK